MESSYESHIKFKNKVYPLGLSYNHRNNDDCLHWHENIEILYFIDGECSVVNGNEEISVKKGDIIIINSEAIHGTRFNNKFADFILVHLDHSFCESIGFNTSDVRFYKKINDKNIAALITKALKEQNEKKEYYQESVKITLLSVLLQLFRSYIVTDSNPNKTSTKVMLSKKIIKYINKHFDELITIEAIEDYCRYSRYYISRAFKETTGLTIMEYLNTVRIEYAKSMLQGSDLSVNQVAERCGFISQSYFSKVFKKSENLSPLEYKVKHQT